MVKFLINHECRIENVLSPKTFISSKGYKHQQGQSHEYCEHACKTVGMSLALQTVEKRQVKNGIATNDLVVSAYAEGNDQVFPRILDLYVSKGSTVADATYGKGVFWRNIPKQRYYLLATDMQDGVDCRGLPYQEESIGRASIALPLRALR